MLTAVDPRRLGLQPDLDRAQVQGPPPAPSLATVVGRRAALTPTAPTPGPRTGPNTGDEDLLVLDDLLSSRTSNQAAMITAGAVSLLGMLCYLPALRHERSLRDPQRPGHAYP